jgi:hypothetical protein
VFHRGEWKERTYIECIYVCRFNSSKIHQTEIKKLGVMMKLEDQILH